LVFGVINIILKKMDCPNPGHTGKLLFFCVDTSCKLAQKLFCNKQCSNFGIFVKKVCSTDVMTTWISTASKWREWKPKWNRWLNSMSLRWRASSSRYKRQLSRDYRGFSLKINNLSRFSFWFQVTRVKLWWKATNFSHFSRMWSWISKTSYSKSTENSKWKCNRHCKQPIKTTSGFNFSRYSQAVKTCKCTFKSTAKTSLINLNGFSRKESLSQNKLTSI